MIRTASTKSLIKTMARMVVVGKDRRNRWVISDLINGTPTFGQYGAQMAGGGGAVIPGFYFLFPCEGLVRLL